MTRPGVRAGFALVVALAALACDNATVPDLPESEPIPLPDPADVDAVVFLLGDGGATVADRTPILQALAADVEAWSGALGRDSAVSVVYLGDIVYPVGVRPQDHPDYAVDTARLYNQVRLVGGPEALDHSTLGLFLAGNHDWGNTTGPDGIRRLTNLQEHLARSRVEGPKVSLLPEAGSPGPTVRDLRHNVRLILMDTHWFLQSRSASEKNEFFERVDEALRTAGDRHVIMAEHHPYYSAGPHGALIAGPGALGIPFLLKKTGTLVQDLESPVYYDFLQRLRSVFIDTGKPPLVFAGGHDHSLQVLRGRGDYDPTHILVSGSGSKLTPITSTPGMRYGASRPGYMMLVFRRDDAVDLFVVAGDPDRLTCDGLTMSDADVAECMAAAADSFDISYSETLAGPPDQPLLAAVPDSLRPATPWWDPARLAQVDDRDDGPATPADGLDVPPEEAEALETGPPPAVPRRQLYPSRDSVEARPGETYPAGPIRKALFGDLNRHLWEVPFKVPVLDLDSLGGGVTIDELSGGKQTLGLHLIGENGVRYQFRSMVKDAGRAVPEPLANTPLRRMLQDQMAAQFPLAAMVVAELLEAADVMVAKPVPVVMPDHPRLGEYRDAFAGRMGWIEVRPDEREGDLPGWAGSSKVTGSEELYEELAVNPASHADQEALLRARLVDMLVGDWDRHSDQWRWASFEEDGRIRWVPIPRDRDWAFARVDGVLPRLVGWVMRKYVGFGREYPPIERLTHSADNLETRLLNEMEREDYLAAARRVQRALTDSVLAAAVDVLPPSYLEREREPLLDALRNRRDGLVTLADRWYRLRAETVDVYGTTEVDHIELEWHADGRLTVRARAMGPDGMLRYERVFRPEATRSVRLHLTEEQDEVVETGEGPRSIGVERVTFEAPDSD